MGNNQESDVKNANHAGEDARVLDLLDLGERYLVWCDDHYQEVQRTPWWRLIHRLWHSWLSVRYDRLSKDAFRQAASYSGSPVASSRAGSGGVG